MSNARGLFYFLDIIWAVLNLPLTLGSMAGLHVELSMHALSVSMKCVNRAPNEKNKRTDQDVGLQFASGCDAKIPVRSI